MESKKFKNTLSIVPPVTGNVLAVFVITATAPAAVLSVVMIANSVKCEVVNEMVLLPTVEVTSVIPLLDHVLEVLSQYITVSPDLYVFPSAYARVVATGTPVAVVDGVIVYTFTKAFP